jgi:hypothetical protein
MTTPTETESRSEVLLRCPVTGVLARDCSRCGGTVPHTSDPARLPAGGDLVVVLALDSIATGEPREVLKLVSGERPAFQTIDGETFHLDEQGQAWRFAEEPDKPARRCTAPVVIIDGEPLCGAVLGRVPLACVVCAGARCFPHCGCIDHFDGRLISRGGTDSGLLEWRIREIADRFVMAQLYRKTERGLAIVGTVSGAPGESYQVVFRRFEQYVAAQAAGDLIGEGVTP